MDLAYQGIRYILSGKKSTILLWLWTLSVTFSAVTSNAQEPSEKRKWIGWGAAYGSYEQDDLKAEVMKGREPKQEFEAREWRIDRYVILLFNCSAVH